MKDFDIVKLIDGATQECLAVGKIDRVKKTEDGGYISLRFTPKFEKPIRHMSFGFALGWRLLFRDPMQTLKESFDSDQLYEFVVVEQ